LTDPGGLHGLHGLHGLPVVSFEAFEEPLAHHPCHPSARLPGAGFTHRYSAFVGPTHSPPIIGSWQIMVIMGMGPLEELKKVGAR